jgi:hypothetical protein
MHVLGVERTNVAGDVDLLEHGGAVGRGGGGGHLALPLMWGPPRRCREATSLRAKTLGLRQVHARFVPQATQQLYELHRMFVHAPVANQEILAWALVVGQHR